MADHVTDGGSDVGVWTLEQDVGDLLDVREDRLAEDRHRLLVAH